MKVKYFMISVLLILLQAARVSLAGGRTDDRYTGSMFVEGAVYQYGQGDV